MASEFHMPFLEATRNVFQLMLDLTDIKDLPAEIFDGENELDISIEIVGDISGVVVLPFSPPKPLSILSTS